MDAQCKSITIQKLTELITELAQRISALIISLPANVLKGLADNISAVTNSNVKTILSEELKSDVALIQASLLKTYLEGAVQRAMTSKDFTAVRQTMEAVYSHVHRITTIVFGVPDIDLILLSDHLIDWRKHFLNYVNSLNDLYSLLSQLEGELPTEGHTNTFLERLKDAVERARKNVSAASDRLLRAIEAQSRKEPYFPLVRTAKNHIWTAYSILYAALPTEDLNRPEFLKNSLIYKIYLLYKKYFTDDLLGKLPVNYIRFKEAVSTILTMKEITKGPLYSLNVIGDALNRFIVAVLENVSNILDGVADSMRTTPSWALGVMVYNWIVVLLLIHELLRALLDSLTGVDVTSKDKREEIRKLIDKLEEEDNKDASSRIFESFSKLSASMGSLQNIEVIKRNIATTKRAISDELNRISRMNSIAAEIQTLLPEISEFNESVVSLVKEIGEKFGIPADKFSPDKLRHIYEDARIAASVGVTLYNSYKCLEKAKAEAKTVTEARAYQDMQDIATASQASQSATKLSSLESAKAATIKEYQNMVAKLKEFVAYLQSV